MPAAPRFSNLVTLLSLGLAELEALRLRQTNFGIATEEIDATLYSLWVSESSVEERHSIYATPRNAQIT